MFFFYNNSDKIELHYISYINGEYLKIQKNIIFIKVYCIFINANSNKNVNGYIRSLLKIINISF